MWRIFVKLFLAIIITTLIAVDVDAKGGSHGGTVSVRGYTRKDGTYVAPHTRSAPGSGSSSSSEASSYSGVHHPSETNSTTTEHTTVDTTNDDEHHKARGSSPVIPGSSSQSSYGYHPTKQTTTHSDGDYRDTNGILRDGKTGRIHRSSEAKNEFKKVKPCPSTGKSSGACPGYVIDHVKPLKNGGLDTPENMQWQTTEDAKAKDKWE